MVRRPASVGIKDVAARAGVSVGTVSNVLNRPESVSAAKRERVQAAIAALGYVPNVAARLLKAGVSRAVGLVTIDAYNPFYGSLALGVENMAEAKGLGLFVANSHGRLDKEQFYLSQFEQQRARGVIVAPCTSDLTEHRAAASRGVRLVLVDFAPQPDEFCVVGADDVLGAYLAVKHLVELGRRRITVIGGPEELQQVGRRWEGARRAAAEAPGVRLDYVAPSEMSILAGRFMVEDILDTGDLPDAIFAMNDLLAIGALQAMVMNRRIRVPEDIALIGYDDIDFCASGVVPISSIHQPSAEMGRRALELLEDEIAQGSHHQHRNVELRPSLVVRESTAGPRHG